MAWTEYQTAGVVVIVIGIILMIAGVVVLALDQSNQKTSEWWVWALIVIGVIGLIVGIALFFIPSPKTALEEQLEIRQTGCPGVMPAGGQGVMSLTPIGEGMPAGGQGVMSLTPIGEGTPCPPARPAIPAERLIPAVAPVVAPAVRPRVTRRATRGQLMPRADLIPSDVYCPQYQAAGAGVLCPADTAYEV